MNIIQALLCAVGVSHEAMERLITRLGDGALGAKLTGGGGGGCMIALKETEKLKDVAKPIRQAGGDAFNARKEDQGVSVEPEP